MSVMELWRRIKGRSGPVPPGIGQAIQEREQQAARQRVLKSNSAEYRWSGR